MAGLQVLRGCRAGVVRVSGVGSGCVAGVVRGMELLKCWELDRERSSGVVEGAEVDGERDL